MQMDKDGLARVVLTRGQIQNIALDAVRYLVECNK